MYLWCFANDQVMYVLCCSFEWVVVSIEIMYDFRERKEGWWNYAEVGRSFKEGTLGMRQLKN